MCMASNIHHVLHGFEVVLRDLSQVCLCKFESCDQIRVYNHMSSDSWFPRVPFSTSLEQGTVLA